ITPLIDAWKLCELGMLVFCSHHFVDTIPRLIDARPVSLVSWYKRNSMPSSCNVPQYETEFIWAFKKLPGLNWRELRGFYDIPMLQAGCIASPERVCDGGVAIHPAQKPTALLFHLLRVGGVSVLDP